MVDRVGRFRLSVLSVKFLMLWYIWSSDFVDVVGLDRQQLIEKGYISRYIRITLGVYGQWFRVWWLGLFNIHSLAMGGQIVRSRIFEWLQNLRSNLPLNSLWPKLLSKINTKIRKRRRDWHRFVSQLCVADHPFPSDCHTSRQWYFYI